MFSDDRSRFASLVLEFAGTELADACLAPAECSVVRVDRTGEPTASDDIAKPVATRDGKRNAYGLRVMGRPELMAHVGAPAIDGSAVVHRAGVCFADRHVHEAHPGR